MENIETQQLINACEMCSKNIVTPDGGLNSLLLAVAFRLKELQQENQNLIQLLTQHNLQPKVEKPNNIIAFPTPNKKS
jgi:hypothetical protein